MEFVPISRIKIDARLEEYLRSCESLPEPLRTELLGEDMLPVQDLYFQYLRALHTVRVKRASALPRELQSAP
jgi:hypothetical protein